MSIIIELIFFFASMIILGKSSHLMIKSAVDISKATKVGELAGGFLILSLIRSLPEMIISLIAIKNNNVGISIGNIMGSNVTNIFLILGLIATIKP